MLHPKLKMEENKRWRASCKNNIPHTQPLVRYKGVKGHPEMMYRYFGLQQISSLETTRPVYIYFQDVSFDGTHGLYSGIGLIAFFDFTIQGETIVVI